MSKPFVLLTGMFAELELQNADALHAEALKTPDHRKGDIPGVRECSIGWTQNAWLHDRLQERAYIANESYGFDECGIVEPMQCARYIRGQHFTWHMDRREGTVEPRKLSIILMLSRADDYDGGYLELMTGLQMHNLTLKRGDVLVFPSWTVHRITPVSRGERRTIVAWLGGPEFR